MKCGFQCFRRTELLSEQLKTFFSFSFSIFDDSYLSHHPHFSFIGCICISMYIKNLFQFGIFFLGCSFRKFSRFLINSISGSAIRWKHTSSNRWRAPQWYVKYISPKMFPAFFFSNGMCKNLWKTLYFKNDSKKLERLS